MEAVGSAVLDSLAFAAQETALREPAAGTRVVVAFNTVPRHHHFRHEYADRADIEVAVNEVERRMDEDIAPQSYSPVGVLTLVGGGVRLTRAQRQRLAGTTVVELPETANDAQAMNMAVCTARGDHAGEVLVLGDSCSSYATTQALRSAAYWLKGKVRFQALHSLRLPDDVSSESEAVGDLLFVTAYGLHRLRRPCAPDPGQVDLMSGLAAYRISPGKEELFPIEYGNDGAGAAYARRPYVAVFADPAFAHHTGRKLSPTEQLLTRGDQLAMQQPNQHLPA
jgi:hypothetical protein